ncbi:Cell division cycle protein [Scedosporium apiospermum]|uniref:Cell division cycle protein n=1 Tax=Pseudallescheria apiosperma TaxID=563466 RepID=A0A084GGL9_PSEDA|nr:Cell division cycle protein [Scedosporium apiospermum]KEZ46481.1 Cell division cycle protein [Scedosporium apiospermum]
MPPHQPAAEPQWPPRSPHEALISTPGGREKLRRMAERTSPSPSPLRKSRAMNSTRTLSNALSLGNEIDDEGDEDEETLQLKLQEIQARLKLKKLQRDKSQARSSASGSTATTSSLGSAPPLAKGDAPGTKAGPKPGDTDQRPSVPTVIPASPVRRVQPPSAQTSPSRVLLGIDKGLRAKDVSLKRAPSLRRPTENQAAGNKYLRTSKTNHHDSSQSSVEAPRPMSFNERLAAARGEEEERRERQERIRNIRTNAFGISKDEMDKYKSAAVSIPDEELRPPEFSRTDILGAQSNLAGGLRRSNTTSGVSSQREQQLQSGVANENMAGNKPEEPKESESASFEVYSSFHLSKRIVPHPTLARHLKGKAMFGIKDLLKQVKSPDYELPDLEEDIVVFAIVASKSEPRSHKAPENGGTKNPERTKYMVVTVVDLQWELELFLFNSGFTRFWKIPEGTVIAILNPTIMPPPASRAHSGKFSLVINSDADTIIEIGTARDLGFCKSMKKDGKLCNSWVNKKRTEFCEFHSNEIVRKARSTRIELNQMGFGSEYRKKPTARKNFDPMAMSNGRGAYDRETHSHWYATKSMSAADLIDGAADRKEREEALKRRLIAREKEQQIMKALSKTGSGTGQEYMRTAGRKAGAISSSSAATSACSTQQSAQETKPPDARELGLLAPKGAETSIRLSPIKRKRTDSSLSSRSGGGTVSALGWGTSLKDKLARMKEGEKLVREEPQSPVKKKTRFITEKGIREAGRESLGEELMSRQVVLDDDDDDELVILR